MPRYLYTAKSLDGETKSGVLEAKDLHQLAKTLRQEGLILIKAGAEGGAEKKSVVKALREFFALFRNVSFVEKMMFTRNLQVMVAAGLTLPRALTTLIGQAKSKKFKKVLLDIKEEIIKGKNFSESLIKYPEIFSELFQNMIKVGEETGSLEESLKVLARQMEREHELRSKVKGAMVYPLVIVLAMFGIGILMMVMVVPKLAETFRELDVELPFTTQLIIKTADFLVTKWYLAVLISFLFIFLFVAGLKTKKGKEIIDKLVLKIPVFSPIIKKTNSAYTVRTLSSLVSAGISLPKSLEVVAGVLGNVCYKTALISSAEKVRKGERLSDALRPYQDIYPSLVVQMLAVGEETGETSGILSKLADFFEEEVLNATKNLTSIIEPLLMIIVGGVVGFFAISMIQPIYSMLGAIQ